MTREEAIEKLTETEYTDRDFYEAVGMAIEALEQKPVVRCKECKHRYDFNCPMYYEEWFTIDEGDGYYDSDFHVIDETQDDGFCYQGEREEA